MMANPQSIALCRVSTHRQSNENNSLEKQIANVRAAAETLKAPIVETWRVAVSSKAGKNLDRKDLRAALAYCSKHRRVKYCIVDEVDRFMRSIEEYYWYKVELKKRGVSLVFASAPELNELSQESVFREMIAIYNAESDNTGRSKKVTAHMQATLARGYWPFPVKAGYRRTLTAGLHEPDPARFPLLQQAMKMIIARTHTIKEAREWLNDQGYRTLSGNTLDLDKFTSILKEPYYCGHLSVKGWPLYRTGIHQPMISPEEFEQLQEIASGRIIKKRRRHYNSEFPGQKLFSCGKCGTVKRITGSTSSNGHGGKFARYYCMSCRKYWNKDKLHEAVDRYLSAIALDEQTAQQLEATLAAVWRQKNNDRQRRIAVLNTKITSLSATKSNLVMSYANTPDPELKLDIEEQLRRVRSEISDCEERIALLKKDDAEIDRFIKFAIGYLKNLTDNWWQLEPEARLWCQKIIFPGEILVHDNYKIGTTKLSPIFTLENTKSSPKAANNVLLVELRGTAPRSDR